MWRCMHLLSLYAVLPFLFSKIYVELLQPYIEEVSGDNFSCCSAKSRVNSRTPLEPESS